MIVMNKIKNLITNLDQAISSKSKPISKKNLIIYIATYLPFQFIFFAVTFIFVYIPYIALKDDYQLVNEFGKEFSTVTIIITLLPTLITLFITGIFTLINIITNSINKINRDPYTIYILKIATIFIITGIFIFILLPLIILLGLLSFILKIINYKKLK